MSDLISKALLAGLGLASLTKDAIQKTAEDLVDRSKLSEAEGRRLVKDLQRRSTEAQKSLEKTIHATVHKVLKSMNLAETSVARKVSRSAKSSRPAKSSRSAKPSPIGKNKTAKKTKPRRGAAKAGGR